MKIYLDNAATTEIDEAVLGAMLPFLKENYGNASSLYGLGNVSKEAINKARQIIAKSINASPSEIIFTSGGTEANNLVLKGLALNKNKGHIITTKIEHDSILNACKWLEKKGFKVSYLPVDKEGFVSEEDLEKTMCKDTILVSIIHGNNEIGAIQNLEKLGKICRKKGVYFHTDACQSFCKTEIDVKKQNLDFVTLNAHKIHGPKGVGALYIRNGIGVVPLLHGGGQEGGKRSGTENVGGIVGFGKAVEIAQKWDLNNMAVLRDKLIFCLSKIRGAKLNGPEGNKRLCNNVNFSFKGIGGESMVIYLDEKGICASTGSACSSNSLKSSHVLLAIGLKPDEAHSSLRLSLSKYTTEKEIYETIKALSEIVDKLREISPI